MKHLRLFLATLLITASQLPAFAQEPFKGEYYCKEHGISIFLDLYGDSILIPNFEFLGPVSGYMRGDNDSKLYGTWMILDHSIDGNRAKLRMTNDIGSDVQEIYFTMRNDSTFTYKAVGGNEVKKAIKHKLHKIVSEMTFIKKMPREEKTCACKRDE